MEGGTKKPYNRFANFCHNLDKFPPTNQCGNWNKEPYNSFVKLYCISSLSTIVQGGRNFVVEYIDRSVVCYLQIHKSRIKLMFHLDY